MNIFHFASLFSLFLLHITLSSPSPIPSVSVSSLPSSPYPEWAHYHWVWLHSGEANQQAEMDLVAGYLERKIPVGADDLDSEWSTNINNFIFDPVKYPNPQSMIDWFHSKGVRVILWSTSVVDVGDSNYNEGCSNAYFLNCKDCNHCATVNWWHGTGSMVDFSNPFARDWWHQQMDNVLSMGIDGWKCDGTDPYAFELYPISCYSGTMDEQTYAHLYYGDYFNYTRTRNEAGLIMSRPVDGAAKEIYLDYSPRYVMYSGWVGDQDDTFDGLKAALKNYFHSSWSVQNYSNFGSDIGGYDTSVPRTKEILIRWAQLGSMSPLMENGGGGEHRPWMFDDETTEIYRKFVYIHYEFIPYFLSAGTQSMEGNVPVIYPLTEKDSVKPIRNWGYLLWRDVYVSPVVENVTSMSVTFPPNDLWVDYWNLSITYKGGETIEYSCPLDRFPIFLRVGSIIPLYVHDSLSVFGDERFSKYMTFFISYPYVTRSGYQQVRQWKAPSQEVWFEYFDSQKMSVITSASDYDLLFILEGMDHVPKYMKDQNVINEEKNVDSLLESQEDGWLWERDRRLLLHLSPSQLHGHNVTIQFF